MSAPCCTVCLTGIKAGPLFRFQVRGTRRRYWAHAACPRAQDQLTLTPAVKRENQFRDGLVAR